VDYVPDRIEKLPRPTKIRRIKAEPAKESGKAVFFGGMNDHTKSRVADVEDGKVLNQRVAEKFSSEQFADAAVKFLQTYSPGIRKVGDQQPLTVDKPKPKEVSFDGYLRKADQWQPEWIIQKYFQRVSPQR
jgi:hypothetical protein